MSVNFGSTQPNVVARQQPRRSQYRQLVHDSILVVRQRDPYLQLYMIFLRPGLRRN